jgi:DNA transformation protein
MKVGPEFRDHLQDLFGALGTMRARSMFGGVGLYIAELMFGFLDRDETIHLRVDAETRPIFEAAGSEPFRYPLKTGEEMEIGYWRIPEVALDSPDDAVAWGRLALEAAMRKRASKPMPRKSKPSPASSG